MFNMKSVVRRTDSTEMQSMADLEENTRAGHVIALRVTNYINQYGRKSHLEETAQSFIDHHLNTLNLLRKNI